MDRDDGGGRREDQADPTPSRPKTGRLRQWFPKIAAVLGVSLGAIALANVEDTRGKPSPEDPAPSEEEGLRIAQVIQARALELANTSLESDSFGLNSRNTIGTGDESITIEVLDGINYEWLDQYRSYTIDGVTVFLADGSPNVYLYSLNSLERQQVAEILPLAATIDRLNTDQSYATPIEHALAARAISGLHPIGLVPDYTTRGLSTYNREIRELEALAAVDQMLQQDFFDGEFSIKYEARTITLSGANSKGIATVTFDLGGDIVPPSKASATNRPGSPGTVKVNRVNVSTVDGVFQIVLQSPLRVERTPKLQAIRLLEFLRLQQSELGAGLDAIAEQFSRFSSLSSQDGTVAGTLSGEVWAERFSVGDVFFSANPVDGKVTGVVRSEVADDATTQYALDSVESFVSSRFDLYRASKFWPENAVALTTNEPDLAERVEEHNLTVEKFHRLWLAANELSLRGTIVEDGNKAIDDFNSDTDQVTLEISDDLSIVFGPSISETGPQVVEGKTVYQYRTSDLSDVEMLNSMTGLNDWLNTQLAELEFQVGLVDNPNVIVEPGLFSLLARDLPEKPSVEDVSRLAVTTLDTPRGLVAATPPVTDPPDPMIAQLTAADRQARLSALASTLFHQGRSLKLMPPSVYTPFGKYDISVESNNSEPLTPKHTKVALLEEGDTWQVRVADDQIVARPLSKTEPFGSGFSIEEKGVQAVAMAVAIEANVVTPVVSELSDEGEPVHRAVLAAVNYKDFEGPQITFISGSAFSGVGYAAITVGSLPEREGVDEAVVVNGVSVKIVGNRIFTSTPDPAVSNIEFLESLRIAELLYSDAWRSVEQLTQQPDLVSPSQVMSLSPSLQMNVEIIYQTYSDYLGAATVLQNRLVQVEGFNEDPIVDLIGAQQQLLIDPDLQVIYTPMSDADHYPIVDLTGGVLNFNIAHGRNIELTAGLAAGQELAPLFVGEAFITVAARTVFAAELLRQLGYEPVEGSLPIANDRIREEVANYIQLQEVADLLRQNEPDDEPKILSGLGEIYESELYSDDSFQVVLQPGSHFRPAKITEVGGRLKVTKFVDYPPIGARLTEDLEGTISALSQWAFLEDQIVRALEPYDWLDLDAVKVLPKVAGVSFSDGLRPGESDVRTAPPDSDGRPPGLKTPDGATRQRVSQRGRLAGRRSEGGAIEQH